MARFGDAIRYGLPAWQLKGLERIKANDGPGFRAWMRAYHVDANMEIDNCPILIWAMQQGAFSVFNEIMALKPNLNNAFDDLSVVHWAVLNEDSYYLDQLIADKADLNVMAFGNLVLPISLCFDTVSPKLDTAKKMVKAGAVLDVPGLEIETPLMKAAEKGSMEGVKWCLENGADVNAVDSNGLSAVARALIAGKEDVAQLLIERGASLETRDDLGRTPLMIACQRGDIFAVKRLLKFGAKIDVADDMGLTPLMWALENGDEDLWNCLKENGVNLDARDAHGRTALLITAQINHPVACKWLLDNEANRDIRDINNKAVIEYAKGSISSLLQSDKEKQQNRDLGVRGAFAKLALFRSFKDDDVKTFKRVFKYIQSKTDVSNFELNGKPLLLCAMRNNCPRIFDELLEMGADPNACCWGVPLLHYAASCKKSHFLKSMLNARAGINARDLTFNLTAINANELTIENGQILIDNGIDFKERGPFGKTLVIAFAQQGLIERMNLLLDNGADIDEVDDNDMTAMMWAMLAGQEAVVDELKARGANIYLRDKQNSPLILFACTSGKKSMVQKVMRWGFKPNAKNALGVNCMIAAAESGDEDLLGFLKEQGLSVNAQADNGFSPLMVAVKSNNLKGTAWLLANGADKSLEDKGGSKAEDMIQSREMFELLLAHEQPQKKAQQTVQRPKNDCRQM